MVYVCFLIKLSQLKTHSAKGICSKFYGRN